MLVKLLGQTHVGSRIVYTHFKALGTHNETFTGRCQNFQPVYRRGPTKPPLRGERGDADPGISQIRNFRKLNFFSRFFDV